MQHPGGIVSAGIHLGLAVFAALNKEFMVAWLAAMVGVSMLMIRYQLILHDRAMEGWEGTLRCWAKCQDQEIESSMELSRTLEAVRKYLKSGCTVDDRITLAREVAGEQRYAEAKERQATQPSNGGDAR